MKNEEQKSDYELLCDAIVHPKPPVGRHLKKTEQKDWCMRAFFSDGTTTRFHGIMPYKSVLHANMHRMDAVVAIIQDEDIQHLILCQNKEAAHNTLPKYLRMVHPEASSYHLCPMSEFHLVQGPITTTAEDIGERTYTAQQVMNLLHTQPFADWYAGDFEKNIRCDDGAPPNEEVLRQLKDLLQRWGR